MAILNANFRAMNCTREAESAKSLIACKRTFANKPATLVKKTES
jgi:hypothetical protein